LFCVYTERDSKIGFDYVGSAIQNFYLHSRLGHWQWSLASEKNFEQPSCQIPIFKSRSVYIAYARFSNF